jgi:hypothetical protein
MIGSREKKSPEPVQEANEPLRETWSGFFIGLEKYIMMMPMTSGAK